MKLGHSSLLALSLLLAPALSRAEPPAPAAAAPVPVPVPEDAPASAPASAPAPAPARFSYRSVAPPAPLVADESPARPIDPPRYDYLRASLGFRIGYVGDPAFDTFASDDVLAQMSLDASYAFYTRGKLAIAAGLAWDVGSRTAGARAMTTKLTTHRLTVPVEARWYFSPWLGVFGKVAPGASSLYARVEDPSAPATLEQVAWVLAADVSAGASLRIMGSSDHQQRRARLWLTPEIGYGLTTSHALRPRPDRDQADALGSDEAARLGSLAMSGLFWRASLSMTF